MKKATMEAIIKAGHEVGFFRQRSVTSQEKSAADVAMVCEATDAECLKVLQKEKERIDAEKVKKSEEKRLAAQRKEEAKAALPLSAGVDSVAQVEKSLPAGKYLLTVAQNNTDVDANALAILKNYAERNGAQILCAAMTYNKNAFQQGLDSDDLYYAPELSQYMVSGSIDLGGLVFLADSNVIPTSTHPLSGFEMAGNGRDIVIPASKIALQCIPALKGRTVRRMASTGAITKRNYIMRKAGAIAAIGHNIGALFVDTSYSLPIIRQLEIMPDSKCLYDANKVYFTDGSIDTGATPEVFQPGDIHAENLTEKELGKLVKLVQYYQPENIVLHDLLDFKSRNHHNRESPAFIFEQHVKGATVKSDLEKVLHVCKALVSVAGSMVHVVKSNHDDALLRWLDEADYREDATNAVLFLELQAKRYKALQSGESFDPLRDSQEYPLQVHFYALDESIMIAGVEHGNHGHNGANGARGSAKGFMKLGVPMNTGHTHSPSIFGGVYTAGCNSLDMGYNVGASSWAVAHVVTWPNGQRQVIFD